MRKIKMSCILSVVMILTACNGIVENGAKIIYTDKGKCIELPAPPQGYIPYVIDCSSKLYITYKDTINKKDTIIRYFKTSFMSLSASNYKIVANGL